MGGRCCELHQEHAGHQRRGKPVVDFKTLLAQEDDKTIGAAFRSGWQADYPSIYNFLQPLYVTGAASNKGFYSSSEFDGLITQPPVPPRKTTASPSSQQAQELLLKDLPVHPAVVLQRQRRMERQGRQCELRLARPADRLQDHQDDREEVNS